MNLLSTIKKVAEQVPEKFLAPIPSADTVSLFSMQGNIPYWFHIKNPKPGWRWVEPIAKNKARIIEEAEPFEYIDYLNQLPKLLCIVLFSLGEGKSLVMPYNQAWKNSEPKILHLTRGHQICSQPLSVIATRQMGESLLYQGMGYSTQAIQLSYAVRQQLENKENISGIPKLFQSAYEVVSKKFEKDRIAQKALTTEDKIRNDLSFVGAALLNWNEKEEGYIIEYEYEGATFQIDLGQNRRVESAGICLDGTELNHNLSTIVLAMQEARQRHRYDLDEDLWV